MDLIKRILECKEDEVDSIIKDEIEKANKNADKVAVIGFLPYGTAEARLKGKIPNAVYKGFISLDTKIKYDDFSLAKYKMESTDFIYEFAHIVKEHNINKKSSLIKTLETFINIYFGYSENPFGRTNIFTEIANKNSTNDDEYFKELENGKLEYLKGTNTAMCTERSAVAQQILSLFGIESYYCMGCIAKGDKQEGHCFNIVKRKNDYALLDYSIPITVSNTKKNIKTYYPFVGVLTKEEFEDFINNDSIKSFDNYYIKDGIMMPKENKRLYIVGKHEIEMDKQNKTI